jgi:phospholipase/carboxylesterase
MIVNKASELGLTNNDVILLGFSQGTMVSLYLALSTGLEYKTIVGFSGALILPGAILPTKTPVCLIHGEEDEVVHPDNMQKTAKILQDLGLETETLLIPYLAHSIDMKGIEKAVEFITKRQ